MFYGFKNPKADDMVFKVTGDVEQVRLFDYAAREVLCGAVQSTIRDGIRHYWAEALTWLTTCLGRIVAWLSKYKLLKPLAWLLTIPLFIMLYVTNRAVKADFTKRRFVQDANGNYTLMAGSISMEHSARAVAKQLNINIVSEHFPQGFSRNPKPARNGSFTLSFTTVTGIQVTLDLQGD